MASNLAELFKESSVKFKDKPAFYSKDDSKKYIPIKYGELYQVGLELAEALVDLGVEYQEKVALLADNRKEWIISDYGIILAGAANVPRGTDITDSEIQYILDHSEAKVVFVEHDKMLEKLKKNISALPKVKTIIVMDPKFKSADTISLYDLLEKGKALRAKGSKKAEERISKIKPDDLFTLIYTSGTTGNPKGVMLMHSNMIHQTNEVVSKMVEIEPDERMLSILPIWHVFERVFEYMAIKCGCATYYTNVRDLKDDMKKVKPTFMASAPRLWENIYNGLYARINDPKQTPGARRFLFNLAYLYSKNFHSAERFVTGKEVDYTGRNPIVSFFRGIYELGRMLVFGPFTLTISSIVLSIFLTDLAPLFYVIGVLGLIFNVNTLDLIVLSKIREATGGELKASVSGGGALQRHVDAFFNDIGISVLEGYGMTETSPVISSRTFKNLIQGSVGDITPKAQVQLRDINTGEVVTHIDENGKLIAGKLGVKGVIHVKGPQVMKGYFKNPEATAKAIKDGWMDTGDLGMFNFKKTLTITGRAKDTVVLLGGENVEPVPIENKLVESPLINQCMVVGQDQKNLGAIIVPDFEKLKEWAKANGVTETSPDQLIANPKVVDLYKKEIKNLNSTKTGFKSFEQVTPFFLITKAFEIGDEITNLGKIKRHVVTEKYKDQIKKIYAEG